MWPEHSQVFLITNVKTGVCSNLSCSWFITHSFYPAFHSLVIRFILHFIRYSFVLSCMSFVAHSFYPPFHSLLIRFILHFIRYSFVLSCISFVTHAFYRVTGFLRCKGYLIIFDILISVFLCLSRQSSCLFHKLDSSPMSLGITRMSHPCDSKEG
jgi:hypothetical protein